VIDAQGADRLPREHVQYPRRTLNAGQQRNFFTTAAIGDTYNTERIGLRAWPNAVLFNTGANDVLAAASAADEACPGGPRFRHHRPSRPVREQLPQAPRLNRRLRQFAVRANAVCRTRRATWITN